MEIHSWLGHVLFFLIGVIGQATSNQNQNEGITITNTHSAPVCGFDTVHEDTYEINSPSYPTNVYRYENYYCYWRLTAPTGKKVRLILNDIKYNKKCNGYFRVWDGPTTSSTLLHKLTEMGSHKYIVSSSESLNVQHYSYPNDNCKDDVGDRGFHLEYSIYENEVCSSLINDDASKCDGEEVCNCKGDYCIGGGSCDNGDVFIRGQPVGDTNWDLTDAKVMCKYMGFNAALRHTTGRSFATRKNRNKFAITDVRCNGTESLIEDCKHRKFDLNAQNQLAGVECIDLKMQRLCNENSECITWYSESFCDGKADLEDGSDEVGCNSQVTATLKHNIGGRCYNTIDRKQRMIRSPGFPNVYGHNLDCKWLLKAPQGKKIVLHFDEFKSEDCHDGMSIYDGETVKWWERQELRQEMCGSSIPLDVESTWNTLLITWSSDESISLKGFKLRYDIK